jgi:hypothetical protein
MYIDADLLWQVWKGLMILSACWFAYPPPPGIFEAIAGKFQQKTNPFYVPK